MADVNNLVTLGIGTPASIPHFILVGLTPEGSAPIDMLADARVACLSDDVILQAQSPDYLIECPPDDGVRES